jgi:hypothetical protein
MLELMSPLDNKIVCWGMSCSGKTHFAKQLLSHDYLCFDGLFNWHEIETLGLSCSASLKHIAEIMGSHEKCVLDGWHLTDPRGELAPQDAVFYVIYAPYDQIINQYRVPVDYREQHRHMFIKWYADFSVFLRKMRFFKNDGANFVELGRL